MKNTKKSSWLDALLFANHLETYECGRGLNNRGRIQIYVYRGARWDARTKSRVTARELAADGWKLTHKMDCSN